MGTKEEVQGRFRRRVEVDRGDLGGGESWRHLFFILAFFGFSPHNFVIRAKKKI